MPSRYWGALFAAIGLALVAAGFGAYAVSLNEPREERHQTYRYAADKPLEFEPSVNPNAYPQPLEYREPCKEPKGRDESDLCAQWRAAKAGEDSAFWAQWGVWITGIGILGLLITIIQTRLALDRAKEANDIARKANALQLRPYLGLVDAHETDQRYPMTVTVLIQNLGQTPAIKIRTQVYWFVGVNALKDRRHSAYTKSFAMRDLVPGESCPCPIFHPFLKGDFDRDDLWHLDPESRGQAFASVVIEYSGFDEAPKFDACFDFVADFDERHACKLTPIYDLDYQQLK